MAQECIRVGAMDMCSCRQCLYPRSSPCRCAFCAVLVRSAPLSLDSDSSLEDQENNGICSPQTPPPKNWLHKHIRANNYAGFT